MCWYLGLQSDQVLCTEGQVGGVECAKGARFTGCLMLKAPV